MPYDVHSAHSLKQKLESSSSIDIKYESKYPRDLFITFLLLKRPPFNGSYLTIASHSDRPGTSSNRIDQQILPVVGL